MTGFEIRGVRERLGMNTGQFAQLLGVHVATAYRWEAGGPAPVRLDPLHASLMARLRQTLQARPEAAEQLSWGQALLEAVLVGGTLVGLALLLKELLPDDRR